MNIKIALEKGAKVPLRSTDGAAGWDLFAHIDEPVVIRKGQVKLIPTGVKVQLPKGTYWDLRIRSGLSTKHGLILVNGAGVIDEDYRGIVGVPLFNTRFDAYTIQPGEKIAQAILQCYLTQDIEVVKELDITTRGTGGFGHTGRGVTNA